MTNGERAFLAYYALGWFTLEENVIMRHLQWDRFGRVVSLFPPKEAATGSDRKGGYKRIRFRDGRHRYTVSEHRIIWMLTHNCDIPEGMVIDHIDHARRNNDPHNLEAVTYCVNTQRYYQRKRQCQKKP